MAFCGRVTIRVRCCLPFANPRYPALGVSLLKAEVTRRRFTARVQYFNLRLAELIGPDLYLRLSEDLPIIQRAVAVLRAMGVQPRFEISGGGSDVMDFIGSSVTKSVKMNGNYNFHFDENLMRIGPGR